MSNVSFSTLPAIKTSPTLWEEKHCDKLYVGMSSDKLTMACSPNDTDCKNKVQENSPPKIFNKISAKQIQSFVDSNEFIKIVEDGNGKKRIHSPLLYKTAMIFKGSTNWNFISTEDKNKLLDACLKKIDDNPTVGGPNAKARFLKGLYSFIRDNAEDYKEFDEIKEILQERINNLDPR